MARHVFALVAVSGDGDLAGKGGLSVVGERMSYSRGRENHINMR